MLHRMAPSASSSRCPRRRPVLQTPLVLLVAMLAGCAAGPDYREPKTPAVPSYKAVATAEPAVNRGWVVASTTAPVTDDWWATYRDPVLNQLLQQVVLGNQELAQAEARFRQALALLGGTRAELWPTVDAGAGYSRSATGGSGSEFVGDSTRRGGSRYDLQLNIGWELDLWGRVRRQLEADRAEAVASAADMAAARLSLQATLAQTYFELRVLDEQRRLLDDTLAALQRSVELTENQYRAGIAARSDVVQALTQLETTRAEAVDLAQERAIRENAIAVLTGQPPAVLGLEPRPFTLGLPQVPIGLPSELLQRRPDVVAAERLVVAANARIGVAKTAYFPSLTLSASGGYQNDRAVNLLELPNRFWSVGPALAMTLFDGGARRAQSAQAVAAYDEQVAFYRQTVLEAFEEVENALAQLDVLSRSAAVRQRAVELAEESERLITNQYRAGRVSFLEVASAQATTLSNRRNLLDLTAQRLTASVQLITALGGDWTGELPGEPTAQAAN